MSKASTTTEWGRQDRDLLVELRTEMSGVRQDIKELKDNLSARILLVETAKHDKDDALARIKEEDALHVDYEKRIRNLERWMFMGTGALLLLQVVLKYFL